MQRHHQWVGSLVMAFGLVSVIPFIPHEYHIPFYAGISEYVFGGIVSGSLFGSVVGVCYLVFWGGVGVGTLGTAFALGAIPFVLLTTGVGAGAGGWVSMLFFSPSNKLKSHAVSPESWVHWLGMTTSIVEYHSVLPLSVGLLVILSGFLFLRYGGNVCRNITKQL